jgi:hypothetical protein
MHVDERINTRLSQAIDEHFDLVEIGVIVLASDSLDSLPHNAEANEVKAPVL